MELDVPWSDDVRLDDGANLYLFQFLVIIIRVWTDTRDCSEKMDFHALSIVGLVQGMEDPAALPESAALLHTDSDFEK